MKYVCVHEFLTAITEAFAIKDVKERFPCIAKMTAFCARRAANLTAISVPVIFIPWNIHGFTVFIQSIYRCKSNIGHL